MWRWLRFLVLLVAVTFAVVWMVQNPGSVTLQWRGWRLDTSAGILFAVTALIAIVAAVIYRAWSFIRRVPGEIGDAFRNRRTRKGYESLTQGMVAVAAGDADEAAKQARRATSLLDAPPLTMLLSAQSAQLAGDDKAAAGFFTSMLDNPETEFLGVRGLLNQALKAGDHDAALKLASRAYRLKPKSEWVAGTLFDLQTRNGAWIDAAGTTDDMARGKLLPRPDADRRRAVVAFELSADAAKLGDHDASLRHLKSAVDLAPDLVPAIVALMRRQVANGAHRKAAALAEKTWQAAPHPDLVSPYWDARRAADGLARVKATEKLVAGNKSHVESHLALARASLAAELWGEARRHLGAAGAGKDGVDASARVCRMMAELEEREHGDLVKAREWLVRAGNANADPMWVCADCGNAVQDWSSRCGNCQGFDTFSWRQPPHIAALAAVGGEGGDATPKLAPPDADKSAAAIGG